MPKNKSIKSLSSVKAEAIDESSIDFKKGYWALSEENERLQKQLAEYPNQIEQAVSAASCAIEAKKVFKWCSSALFLITITFLIFIEGGIYGIIPWSVTEKFIGMFTIPLSILFGVITFAFNHKDVTNVIGTVARVVGYKNT